MLEQWDRQALGRGLWTGKLMSLWDRNGAQGIRSIFLWSAFQIILNSLIYFPTRGGREAREPQSSPRGVQSYYILIRLARTLLLGPAPLRLGKAGRTMSWFKANLRVQLTAEHWTLYFLLAWIFSGMTAWKQGGVSCSCWGCLLTSPWVNSFFPWWGPHLIMRSQPAQHILLWELILPKGLPIMSPSPCSLILAYWRFGTVHKSLY